MVYLDDILVPAATFQQQCVNLLLVFHRLREAKLNKCCLFQQNVKYLVHIISKEEISTDPDKLLAIRNWPSSTGVSEVRSFLGLCSYYRRFMKNFADKVQPLHQLTEKEQVFLWTPEAEEAFQQLKTLLTRAPVLGYLLPDGQYILDTHVSLLCVLHLL